MFRPLNKNVLLKSHILSQNPNSIYMGKSQTPSFEVISVGKEVREVKVGDLVYLDETKLIHLNIEHEIYYLLCEDDIYMIVEK